MNIPFEKLNNKQKIAVKSKDNRILILAGPGTGKTEVISHRIRYLIKERKAKPSEILAITFTMKAAGEMFTRLEKFPDVYPKSVRISTIHGKAWEVVCQNVDKKLFIADEDESMMVLEDVIAEFKITKTRKQLKRIRNDISLKKADNILPDDLENKLDDFFKIFKSYENLMKFNNAIDFKGILTKTIRLLTETPEIKTKCHEKIIYLLVDEYQDINKAQFEFIRLLSHHNSELFCVGDDDQSIYSWRGAKPDFILNYKKDFSGGTILELDESRRCPENILTAALNLISKNKRHSKSLHAYSSDGAPVFILESSSECQEAFWIANWIAKRISQAKFKPQDVAIICRDLELAKDVVPELKKRNVPVEYWREGAIFKDQEVKDLIAHLRVVVNTNDNLALRRCLLSRSLERVGKGCVTILREKAQKLDKTIWDILRTVSEYPELKRWGNRIAKFVLWMKELKSAEEDQPASNIIDKVIEKIKSSDNIYLEKLRKIAGNMSHTNVKNFLEKIILRRRLDLANGGPEADEERDAVAIMSMHSAKGLTFKIVFILGLEEGIVPKEKSDIEEERRLCYVAMTRAKIALFLCKANRRKGRPVQGFKLLYEQPSQFLSQILPCNFRQIPNRPTKK